MSILKLRKPRQPLQAVNLGHNDDEEDTTEVRRRRVSFAGVNKIKEFNSEAESVVICDTPAYEEEFTASSESSQIIKHLNHPSSFNSDMNMLCKGVEPGDFMQSKHIMTQDYAASINPGRSDHIDQGDCLENCNYSHESMEITIKDDTNPPCENLSMASMILAEDTMVIPKIIPGMKNHVRNNYLFHTSIKADPKVDCSILSCMDVTVTVDKENICNDLDISQNVEVNKSCKPQPVNNTSFIGHPDKSILQDSSSTVITHSPPISNRSIHNPILALRECIDGDNILNNRSPAHKRYRLSEPSFNPMANHLGTSERNQSRTASTSNNSFHSLVNPGFTDRTQNSINYYNENMVKCPDASYKGNQTSILSTTQNNDKKETSQHPIIGLSNMVLSPCVENLLTRRSDVHDFVSQDKYLNEELSGEDMNLSCVVNSIPSNINENEQKNAVELSKSISNNITRRYSQYSGFITESMSEVTNNRNPLSSQTLHTNIPNSLYDMDLTKVHTKLSKCSENESEINFAYSINVERTESDDVHLLNSFKNDSKRKLDEMKKNEVTMPNVTESRVDRIYTDNHYLSMCNQSQINETRGISFEGGYSLNPSLIIDNVQVDCLKTANQNDGDALILQTEKSEYAHSDKSEVKLLEIVELDDKPLIDIHNLPLETVPILCNKSNIVNYENPKQCTSVTQEKVTEDSIKEMNSDSMELEEFSRDPIIEVASLREEPLEINKLVTVAKDSNATEMLLNCDDNSNQSIPVINMAKLQIEADEDEQIKPANISDLYPSPDKTLSSETDSNNLIPVRNDLKPLIINQTDMMKSLQLTGKDDISPLEAIQNVTSLKSDGIEFRLIDRKNSTVDQNRDDLPENAPFCINESKSMIDNSCLELSHETSYPIDIQQNMLGTKSNSKNGLQLSDEKITGEVLSSLQRYNKNFMEDLDYHYNDWTEWIKSFFFKSVVLLIKVPWRQFTARTPILEISLVQSDKVMNKALKFCSNELICRINKSGKLKMIKSLSDSGKMCSYIDDECKRIELFYQSLSLLELYYPIDIVDSRLTFTIADLKSVTVFTIQIHIKKWKCLSKDDISVIDSIGKVGEKRVRDIFSIIPPGRERFYDFVCALQHLVHKQNY